MQEREESSFQPFTLVDQGFRYNLQAEEDLHFVLKNLNKKDNEKFKKVVREIYDEMFSKYGYNLEFVDAINTLKPYLEN